MQPIKAVAAAIASGLGLCYLDAKYLISYDLHGAISISAGRRNLSSREANDRLNNYCYLEEHANARPREIFLVFQGREWSNRNALKSVRQWANYFLTLGIVKGEIVALNFTNCPAFVFAMFGLWAIGAVPALINFNLSDASLVHCFKVSTAKIMICDDEVARNVGTSITTFATMGARIIFLTSKPHLLKFEVTQVESISEEILADMSHSPPSDSLRAGSKALDPAVLIYTSGSTGMPKAAVVTWTKFSSGSFTSSRLIGIRSSDRFYTCMPLYHGTGTVLGLGTCLMTGATLILGKRFSNTTFWPEVRESRATVIQYVGEVCRYLLTPSPSPRDRLHNVRMAYGNGMRPDVWEAFRSRFGIETIVEFYASTEGVGGSFNYNTGPFGAGAVGRLGSLGQYFARSALSIKVDPETGIELRNMKGLCIQCGVNEPGEAVYVLDTRNPQASFSGYFNNKTASDSKILHDVLIKGDSYLRMGDLLSFDRDGFTYFHDRIGDSFRFKGENVSTTEVSEAIGKFPGILEANVYGIQIPCHDGRAGCAALVLDPSHALDLDAFARRLSRVLPKYAVPQFLRIVAKMEMTGNHKHQKLGFRDQGVDPEKVGKDTIFWYKNDTYVKFHNRDWHSLVSAKVHL